MREPSPCRGSSGCLLIIVGWPGAQGTFDPFQPLGNLAFSVWVFTTAAKGWPAVEA
jgi:hypothetical protein